MEDFNSIYVQLALGAFSTVVSALVSWIAWKIRKIEQAREAADLERVTTEKKAKEKLKSDIEKLKEGDLALLQNRIVSIVMDCINSGHRRVYQTKNVERMYNAYSGLGGNGMVEQLYNEFKHLRIIGNDKNDQDSRGIA